MLTRINKLLVEDGFKIHLFFSDNVEKIVDFKPFIGNDKFTQPLSDPNYFKQVKIYENGRGIYWPNSYDVCPDFLKNFCD